MEAAPFAPDETGRLLALENLKLLDTPPEPRFDRVVQLAARLCGMPIGIMSVVAERKVSFKSSYGLDRAGVSLGAPFRDYWFCSHVVATSASVVVEDARNDDRFSRILPVTAEPGLRAYAGVPIRAPGGAVIGALAVFGLEPCQIPPSSISALADMAKLIEVELSPIPHATHDALTGAMNQRSFERVANRMIEFGDRMEQPCVVLRTDFAGLGHINHAHGFDVGDRALGEAARILGESVRGSDLVGRLGSDEFGVLLFGADAEAAGLVVERVLTGTRAYNQQSANPYDVAFHVGGAVHVPGERGDIAGLLLTAEPRRPAQPASGAL